MGEQNMDPRTAALFAIARELNMQNRIRTLELMYKNTESFDDTDFEDALHDILRDLTE